MKSILGRLVGLVLSSVKARMQLVKSIGKRFFWIGLTVGLAAGLPIGFLLSWLVGLVM